MLNRDDVLEWLKEQAAKKEEVATAIEEASAAIEELERAAHAPISDKSEQIRAVEDSRKEAGLLRQAVLLLESGTGDKVESIVSSFLLQADDIEDKMLPKLRQAVFEISTEDQKDLFNGLTASKVQQITYFRIAAYYLSQRDVVPQHLTNAVMQAMVKEQIWDEVKQLSDSE